MRKLRTPVAIALSTSLIITALPPRPAKANPAVIPAAACIASVGCVATVIIIGGIAYYAITYQGQENEYVPIQDPEATYDESITVYARSEEEARKTCEKSARDWGGAIAECIGCVKMTATPPYRYTCTVRIEPTR